MSFLYTVYPLGKTSESRNDSFKCDSVPISNLMSCSLKNTSKSTCLFTTLQQFTMASHLKFLTSACSCKFLEESLEGETG